MRETEKARAQPFAFTVYNSTSQCADDLHVTIAFTGGGLSNPRILFQPDSCPTGRIDVNPGNRVNVKWDSACVCPGDAVGILVDCDKSPLKVVGVVWTLGGKPIGE